MTTLMTISGRKCPSSWLIIISRPCLSKPVILFLIVSESGRGQRTDNGQKKDVADSASILLVHPYYIRHPTRQPAGTRVCRPQQQFTTPTPALKEKSGNA